MNILLLSGLVLGLLGANPNGTNYHRSVVQTQYQESSCGCSGGYDAAPCDSCGDSCGDVCGEPCGRTCRRGSCCDRTPCGPLTLIFSIFNANTWRGPVCGERYWGDFYSDPPACHDPCDTCGNYVGRSNSAYHWGSMGGYSSTPSGGGCSSCNKNRVYNDQPIPEQETRVVHPTTRVTRQPTPAKQTIRAVQPQR